ncbi:MAG: FG-GAP repeat domain-containing protein [Acidobacteriota bacterium]
MTTATLGLVLSLAALPAQGVTMPPDEGTAQLVVVATCGDPPMTRVEFWPAAAELPADGCRRRPRGYIQAGEPPPAARVPAITSLRPGGFPEKPGWPRRFPRFSGFTVATASLDGGPGLATIIQETDGISQGVIHALDPKGQELPGWPAGIAPASATTVPGSVDIDDDGRDEVMVAVGSFNLLSPEGVQLPGWPFHQPPGGFQTLLPIASRLVAGGPLRVLATNGLGIVNLLDTAGRQLPGWPVSFPPPVPPFVNRLLGSAAVGDITGDGVAEILVTELRSAGSVLYAYHADGSLVDGFPATFGQVLEEPTLADLDGNGALDIVFLTVGKGLLDPEDDEFRAAVFAVTGDGTNLPGWPQLTGGSGNRGVALGDVDGDGELEVVAATAGANGSPFIGGVFLWNADGSLVPGWPQFVSGVGFADAVTIADVDGDGRGDVLAAGVDNFFPIGGHVYAWTAEARLVPGFPIDIGTPTVSAVTVTDLDGDGMADLNVTAWPGIAISVPSIVHWFDLGVPYRPEGMEWPTRAHDMARTGRYEPPVHRQDLAIHLLPRTLSTVTPAPPLTAVVTLDNDQRTTPTQLQLVAVDGTRIEPLPATRLGTGAGRFSARRRLIFRLDGEAVRSQLGAPGVHHLSFRTEVIGGLGGVLFEGNADLRLQESPSRRWSASPILRARFR